MKLEDQRLLWRSWVNSYKIHKLDFIEWINLLGYQIESYLIDDDEKEQAINIKKMREENLE